MKNEDELTNAQRNRADDIFCNTAECYHYVSAGYIYCSKCMHNPPTKLSPEDKKIKILYDRETRII